MGNLCSIYHAHFDKLVYLTGNYNKAVFLDKCLFWWQISTYTLDDETIWFTRQIPAMAKEMNLSISSVNRYLKEFRTSGLIETKNILYGKKRLYLRVTEKLLQNIGASLPQTNKCFDLAQNDTIENANLTVSIYKETDSNLVNNNTVSTSCAVHNLKTNPKNIISSPHPIFAIEELIGERLSLREKNYIKGMIYNLQTQHNLSFSSPEQLFAEITFSLLNEEQLLGISNFNHRVQIIAKLVREKRWRTPKGFYNHSEFGAFFKRKTSTRVSQLPTSSSHNKVELEQRKNSLQLELRTQNQWAFGEERAFIDALEQVKTNPARWHLIKTLTKGLLESFEKQWEGSLALYQVNTQLHRLNPSPEGHPIKIINQQIQALSHLNQQIEALELVIFDKYCELAAHSHDSTQLDRLYEFYIRLNTLTKQITEEVSNLDAQIDLEFAA